MNGNIAGEVMIEIDAARAGHQQSQQRVAILGQRDVEYRQLVPGRGLHARNQRDVALYAGDELAVARLRQA